LKPYATEKKAQPARLKAISEAKRIEVKPLEVYMRYHAAHDRAYQSASAELQKRKKARQLAEIGFASQKRG
jgi:hypothetical protein